MTDQSLIAAVAGWLCLFAGPAMAQEMATAGLQQCRGCASHAELFESPRMRSMVPQAP